MATTNKPCKVCDEQTRRRCRDCRKPVCTDCATHGQCDDCQDSCTFHAGAQWMREYVPSHRFAYHGGNVRDDA